MDRGLTVLIPTYNEPGVGPCIDQVADHLARHGYDFEIVVVDDASTDATPATIAAIGRDRPYLRSLRHATNQGPCSGLKSGRELASRPWLLLLPVDLAIPLDEIETLWEAREGADIVLGYIEHTRARSPLRQFQSRMYTALVNALFRMRLRQVNYVALYRTELLQSLPLTTSGVALHAEILVRATRGGHVIRQVALRHEPRREAAASGSKPSVVLKTAVEILQLRRALGRSVGRNRARTVGF